MKKILLFIILATCGSVFAQKVAVIVNSPASIGGEKIYGGAAFGADSPAVSGPEIVCLQIQTSDVLHSRINPPLPENSVS